MIRLFFFFFFISGVLLETTPQKAGLLGVTTHPCPPNSHSPSEDKIRTQGISIKHTPICLNRECVNVATWSSHDYVSGSLERHEKNIRSSILRILQKGQVFLDIGANIGSHTFHIALQGYEVIAVEAMPANCMLLRTSLCDNGTSSSIRSRISLLEFSLGRQTSREGCTIWSHPSNVGNGQVSCDGSKPCPECFPLETIPMRTLDHVLLHYNHTLLPIGCAKIDIECYEPFLFEGGEKTFRAGLIPYIVFEFNGPLLEERTGMSGVDFLSYLDGLGFLLYSEDFYGTLIPRSRFPTVGGETRDLFMIHMSKVQRQ